MLARKPFRIMATATASVPDLGLYTAPYIIVLPGVPPAAGLPGDSYEALFSPTACLDDEQDVPQDEQLRRALNAGHYSHFMTEGRKRYTQLIGLGSERAIVTASQQLEDRIRGWRGSMSVGHSEDMSTQLAFEVGLDWGAKLVCCLAREVELLKAGRDSLRLWYQNELLPWQCMNLSTQ